jgi:hypothetical protein
VDALIHRLAVEVQRMAARIAEAAERDGHEAQSAGDRTFGGVVDRADGDVWMQTLQRTRLHFDAPVVPDGFAVDHAPGVFAFGQGGAQGFVRPVVIRRELRA